MKYSSENEFVEGLDPLSVFESWWTFVQTHPSINEPRAMTLATSEAQGMPSARVVLLKEYDSKGFVFYTNYSSPKSTELFENPKASLLFYWDPLFRQIRMQGTVKKVPRSQSESYWASRPLESQVSQAISDQSKPVSSREELEGLSAEALKKANGISLPCPPHWGGYLFTPENYEFWIGRENRLHDRFFFELTGPSKTWSQKRLYP